MQWSILSLSTIAHQMWHDYSLSQRKRTAERTVGAGVGGDRKVVARRGGKSRDRQYGGLHRGLAPLCQPYKDFWLPQISKNFSILPFPPLWRWGVGLDYATGYFYSFYEPLLFQTFPRPLKPYKNLGLLLYCYYTYDRL